MNGFVGAALAANHLRCRLVVLVFVVMSNLLPLSPAGRLLQAAGLMRRAGANSRVPTLSRQTVMHFR
jgi:hypothetical protein